MSNVAEISNQAVISALMRAETVVMYLTAQGVTVKSVILRHGQPIIRIARHSWCDRMTARGKTRYDHFGHGQHGRFRQGVYLDDSGCRVVWSESLH